MAATNDEIDVPTPQQRTGHYRRVTRDPQDLSGVRSAISKDSARTFLFSAVGTVIGILTGIFLAKTLGPTGKGLFSGVQVFLGAITAVTGGAGTAITYLMTNQRYSIGDLIRPLSALLAAVTLLVWLSFGLWGLRYGFSSVLLIAAGLIPASIVLSWRSYFYMGLGRIKALNYQGLLLSAGTLAAVVIAVAVFRRGIEGALTAWVVCTYIAAAVVIFQAAALSSGSSSAFQEFRNRLRSLIHFGSRSALSLLLGFLNYRVDSLVLIVFLGASGFGIYSVAVAAGELLFMLPRAINTAAARDLGMREFAASAEVTAKAVRLGTFSAALLAIVLALVGPWFIHLVYGPRFDPAALPLRILLPGIVAFATGGTFSSFFAYQLGRPVLMIYFAATTFAIQLGMCLLLVPRLGLVGAATASTISYLVVALIETWYFSKTTKLSVSKIWLVKRADFAVVRSLLPSLVIPG